MRDFLKRFYFRALFALVRRAGYVPVRVENAGDAMLAAIECKAFCSRSGFLRDNNGNSHKCGKRAERKIMDHVFTVHDRLADGIGRAFAAEGRRHVW